MARNERAFEKHISYKRHLEGTVKNSVWRGKDAFDKSVVIMGCLCWWMDLCVGRMANGKCYLDIWKSFRTVVSDIATLRAASTWVKSFEATTLNPICLVLFSHCVACLCV